VARAEAGTAVGVATTTAGALTSVVTPVSATFVGVELWAAVLPFESPRTRPDRGKLLQPVARIAIKAKAVMSLLLNIMSPIIC
jgi:hypothetical protein